MREWDADRDDPHNYEPADDDTFVTSVEAMDDLILGGTREESLGNYQLLGFHQPPPPATDWTLANRLADAVCQMLDFLPPAPHGPETAMATYIAKIKALKDAYDAYTDIPF